MTIVENNDELFKEVAAGLMEGTVIPYIGPGVFQGKAPFPVTPGELAAWLGSKVTVPGRARGHLSAVAQYIENFKHRKTLTGLMKEAFSAEAVPTAFHRFLAALPTLPLVVDTWYDGTLARMFSRPDEKERFYGQLFGVSRSECANEWFRSAGSCAPGDSEEEKTLIYQPHGSVYPEPNFLVSDSDYVEVLTEIDIQTPIPPIVQRLRTGRHFLFMGCRFNNQGDRIFARQIMKRSSDRHWALIEEETPPKEARFLFMQNIQPIRMGLEEFIEGVTGSLSIMSGEKKETVPCKSA